MLGCRNRPAQAGVVPDGWRAAAFVAAFCVVTCVLPPSAPASAALYPDSTTSYYEQTSSRAALYLQGEAAGKAGSEGIVILDFGRPANDGAGYGTLGFGTRFISLSAVVAGVESFVTAYFRYAPPGLTLDVAVGTSNSCGTGQPCGARICGCIDEPASFYAFGAAWALTVERLRSWAYALGATGGYRDVVRVVAGDDAEPAYDPGYRNTYELLLGYAQTVGGQEPAMVDYGSAEGFWTDAQLFQVAYGFPPDVPMPQIYFAYQASQWAHLLAYAKASHHVTVTIFGVLAGGDPVAAYAEMLGATSQVTHQQAIPWLSRL